MPLRFYAFVLCLFNFRNAPLWFDKIDRIERKSVVAKRSKRFILTKYWSDPKIKFVFVQHKHKM